MKRKPVFVKHDSVQVPIYRSTTATGYSQFTVAWRDAGQRKREAFGSLEGPNGARTRAKEIAKLLASGQAVATSLRKADVDAYQSAVAIIAKTGLDLSLETVCREYTAAVTQLAGRSLIEAVRYFTKMHPVDLKPKAVAEVAAELFAAKERLGLSKDYVDQLKHQCGKLSKMFVKNIGDVTTDDLKLFSSSLAKLAPSTRNNCLRGVRELFSFAKKEKYLPKDFDQLDGIDSFEDGEGDIAIYTPQQMAALLANADPLIVPALAIGAFAGLRGSETAKLDWSEVNLKRRFITVARKNAKGRMRSKARRLVPISKNLAAWLAPHARQCGLVLPMHPDTIYSLRARAATAAGIELHRNALRHSFCSYRLALTQDAARTCLEAGNTPEVLFKHYRELVTPREARAWFGIVPTKSEKVVRLEAAG
jgi:integrase